MKLSLILTGAERHADMQRFFQSLLAQHEPACTIELIFVNQGTFEPPQADLAARGITLLEIRTGRLPLSKARNIGLAEASGDLYAFPDDDCWYPERLLANVMAYLTRRPELDAISTNVFDPHTQRAYGDRPVGLDCEIHFGNLFQLPISVGIFVRRRAFDAAGFFFDEQLGAGTPLGSGEETDMVYRLLRTGSRIEYLGTLQVYHPVPEYQETDVTKYYKYGLGFGYLNGSIVRTGEHRVIKHLSYVMWRSIGGAIFNLHRPVQRQIYLNRLFGVCRGLMQGLRKNADC
ncbi:glycosyltransferase family 2 protein [Comamonadaceae bacterium M7527]|nr:glycosyltransferase family 2 protein [Comamonadaceae bacterium M7527]